MSWIVEFVAIPNKIAERPTHNPQGKNIIIKPLLKWQGEYKWKKKYAQKAIVFVDASN